MLQSFLLNIQGTAYSGSGVVEIRAVLASALEISLQPEFNRPQLYLGPKNTTMNGLVGPCGLFLEVLGHDLPYCWAPKSISANGRLVFFRFLGHDCLYCWASEEVSGS